MLQKVLKVIAHPFEQRGKEAQNFRVSRVEISSLKVLHKVLQWRQHRLRKILEVGFLVQVGLNQNEAVTAARLHRLHDVVWEAAWRLDRVGNLR